MKITKIVVYGLVFVSITLALFASPVFVQKAKADGLPPFMLPDASGPLSPGVHLWGGYTDSEGHIHWIYYAVNNDPRPPWILLGLNIDNSWST